MKRVRTDFQSFSLVAYPESSDLSDIIDTIKAMAFKHYLKNDKRHIEAYSILHDSDYDDNGELKKPHWHIIVKFDFKKNINDFRKYLLRDGCTQCEGCTFNAMKRYLIHIDYEDKTQYSPNQVVSYFNASPYSIEGLQQDVEKHSTMEDFLLIKKLLEEAQPKTTLEFVQVLLDYDSRLYDVYKKYQKEIYDQIRSNRSFNYVRYSQQELLEDEYTRKLEILEMNLNILKENIENE